LLTFSNAFLDLDDSADQPFDINMLAFHAAEIQKVNGIFELTMQPNANLASIRAETYDSLARECLKINEKGIIYHLIFRNSYNVTMGPRNEWRLGVVWIETG
jgi:hypothetical protein